jgi:hypothetical protein
LPDRHDWYSVQGIYFCPSYKWRHRFLGLDYRNINKREVGNIDGPNASDARSRGYVSASRLLFCARDGRAMGR